MEDVPEDTVMFSSANPAQPGDSMTLIKLGGAEVARTQELTGKDRFEHMVLYCLNVLDKAGTGICAFYIDDFPDADETTIRVLQKLIGKAGYVTSNYCEHASSAYKGFWAWRTK